jgi:hypothetical protein
MTKRIKHVSELPEWFKLSNYKEVKNFTLSNWCEQIQGRILFLQAYISIFTSSDTNTHEYKLRTSSLLQLALHNIRSNPLEIYQGEHLRNFLDEVEPSIEPFSPFSYLGVFEFTGNDLLSLLKTLPNDYLKSMMELVNSTSTPDSEDALSPDEPEWLNKPLFNPSSHINSVYDPVIVNLSIPDNILIEHFKTYLKMRNIQKKSNENHIKRFSKSDQENWHRFGVLPFLDLEIWAIENDVNIPYRVFADAIFPDGTCGEETIRKTTLPMVKQLSTDEFLLYLAAQATQEHLEKYHS